VIKEKGKPSDRKSEKIQDDISDGKENVLFKGKEKR